MERDQPNIDVAYADHLLTLSAALKLEAERARRHQLYGLQGQFEDAAASARSWAQGLREANR